MGESLSFAILALALRFLPPISASASSLTCLWLPLLASLHTALEYQTC